ncbi:MAG: ATP-binding cassette domain-containing protein, partial [Eubacterium sp.]|nr:ATP-binding cassette domain-containing protein [Eubacterium sp.]
SQFFYSLMAPLTLFGYFCTFDIRSAVTLLVAVPLIPVSIVIVMKIAKRLLSKYWGAYAELGDSFLDNLNGLTTLKIYGADAEKAIEMDKEAEHFRKITMKVLTMQLNSTSVMDIMAYGGAAVGMIMALKGYSDGRNDISETLMIILLSAEFFLPMRTLGSYFHVAMNGMAASDKIFALLDIEQKTTETSEKSSELFNSEGRVDNDELSRDEYMSFRFSNSVEIELSDVSFSYDGEKKVLNNINMQFPSGKLTAIVGLSGSGKSTLVSILAGRNRNYEGSVKLSGCELSEIQDDIRYSAVSIVTSDSYIFGGTIYDNLKMSCPDANAKSMVNALEQVGLLKELLHKTENDAIYDSYESKNMADEENSGEKDSEELRREEGIEVNKEISKEINKEDGKQLSKEENKKESNKEGKEERLARALTVRLEEGGRNLSGGQRQRLSIARAILADSSVMIFDEATSSIDYDNEQKIMKIIRQLADSRTVILISHRLRNVLAADNIYMIESGNMIGSGKHEKLLKQLPAYRNMYENQQKLEVYNDKSRKRPGSEVVTERIKLRNESTKQTAGKTEIVKEVTEKRIVLTEEDYGDDIFSSERRSGLTIMRKLIVLIRSLIPAMLLAILLGSVGYMAAIMLTVIAAGDIKAENYSNTFFFIMVGMAVVRGLLHYGEQYLNHYIAFKLLARIRHIVFDKLRELCPAKLDRKDKGNLIAILTSDIEKLEVFYAHTISPVMISIIVTVIVTVFLMRRSVIAGLVALLGYYLIGVIIPLVNGKRGRRDGMEAGNSFGSLNSAVLESLYGLDETIQYQDGDSRIKLMEERADKLRASQKKLSILEADQKAFTNLTIQLISLAVMLIVVWQVGYGAIRPIDSLLVLTLVMSSFGPVVALSNLSNNLSNTLASEERVLSLLDEKPKVADKTWNVHSDSEEQSDEENELQSNKSQVDELHEDTVSGIDEMALQNVSFSYGGRFVLQNASLIIPGGHITAIYGPSGCGKSTILKMLMRFYDPQDGVVNIRLRHTSGKLVDQDIKDIPSETLRNIESYLTQETWLFQDTIRHNIEIGRPGASDEQIIEAAQKASIHDFIQSLPEGYDTQVGELGDTLSDGERQRIGVARAFLHDASV